jgi:hypothetical protein
LSLQASSTPLPPHVPYAGGYEKLLAYVVPRHLVIKAKWAEHDIDRFRRNFLLWGDDPDKVKGGHCLVRWKNCIRPKKWGDGFGTLGTLRPWKSLLRYHDKTDRVLFFAST